MESLTFYGDAFSEYYLRNILWDEPKLTPFLGLDTVKASYRRAATEIPRAQRALRARQQARSTRTLLLNPLADLLGWQLGEEEMIDTGEGKENAGQALIFEGTTIARVLAIDPDAPLDLPPTGIHRRFAPSLSIVRVLEELNLNWGIVLNAYEFRLIRRAEGFVASHIGFDLTGLAEGGKAGFEAWQLLWALLRQEAFASEPSILELVVTNGREHQSGVSSALGGQVQEAIVDFLQGLLHNPSNQECLPEPIPQEYLIRIYTEALRVLYRILFALYAEARGLLPVDFPTYREGYSISRLAHLVVNPQTDPRKNPTTSGRYFELCLRALFEMLSSGANLGPEGHIPQYNGAMFDHARTEMIESLIWGDQTIASVLEKLTLVSGKSGLVRLSYRELDVEQLGAVYESLLELVPQIASEAMYRVVLDGRELVVNSIERKRLSERRGEVFASGAVPMEDEEESDFEEDGSDGTEEDEQEIEEGEAVRRSTERPLKVLSEIAPGTVFLKAGLGRKQTGSFYTSRPLVEFLVRRAIDPLADGKTPEQILQLKVLDPAMGSGHFLVGACRRLAEHLLAAYRKRYEEAFLAQPDLPPHDLFLESGVHREVAANWDYEDRALIACRLLVAGNCIYGVDKNPLAVDLARVSLWLATAANDHPLTFLDHRLRVGNSLLGLHLYVGEGEEPESHLLKPDRFGKPRRRQSSNDSQPGLFAGVEMKKIVTAGTLHLRDRLGRALRHLQTISDLMDDYPGDFAGHRAAFEAVQGELEPFVNLHALRIGREFLPPQTATDVLLVNEWLSALATKDRPEETTLRNSQQFIQRGCGLGAFCWHLSFPEVFFSADGTPKDRPGFDAVIGNPPWDKIKPNERECFAEFDPTVWDVQGQERKRLINHLLGDNDQARKAWQSHESETKTMAKLLLEGGFYHHQIAEVEGKKTGGDPDTFKFFTERAWQLLRPEGRAGIIVPLGIQGSLGTTGLRRLLLDKCQLEALIKLDNERYVFPGVFHGQKFDLLVFAKGGHSTAFDAAFFSWEPAEVVLNLAKDHRRLTVDADLYRELTPEQYTFVELHDQAEVDLLRRIYRQFPRLGEKRDDTWNVSFSAEFHMTNDSHLFRDAARLKAFDGVLHSRLPSPTDGAAECLFETDEGGEYWITQEDDYYAPQPERFVRTERWVDSRGRAHLPGAISEEKMAYRLTGYVLRGEETDGTALPVRPAERYVPLYEGRMVHQFDHCQKAYVSGSGRRARWIELPWAEKRIVPHYFMASTDFENLQHGLQECRAGFCDVTGQSNERSALCALLPSVCPAGNSVPTTRVSDGVMGSLLFAALLNSFVADALLRKAVSNHLNFFILSNLVTPRPRVLASEVDLIVRLAGRLTCATADHKGLWKTLSEHWPKDFILPWTHNRACLDIRERARMRAEIDARVALLYGLSPYEYARILSTFPLLDQDQPRLPGDCFIRRTNKGEKIEPRSFITRDLALLRFFELANQKPPEDIVAFFAEAGVNIERNTGPIRRISARVEEATRRGAVAYIPTQDKGWRSDQTSFLPPDLPTELMDDWTENIAKYVTSSPSINGGEPTLAGTRIPAKLIHDLLSQAWTFAQVLESYPHLSPQQVAVALRWGDLR